MMEAFENVDEAVSWLIGAARGPACFRVWLGFEVHRYQLVGSQMRDLGTENLDGNTTGGRS